jgi:glutaredoxin
MSKIKVYGADWCEDTHRTREHLDARGLAYDYINVDRDSAAQRWVQEQNNGKRQTPTLDLSGTILIEPSNEELDEALRNNGIVP